MIILSRFSFISILFRFVAPSAQRGLSHSFRSSDTAGSTSSSVRRANGAEGASPGQRPGYPNFLFVVRPEGAEDVRRTRSIPQEAFVEFEFIPFQE
jgi:hypothetical protein